MSEIKLLDGKIILEDWHPSIVGLDEYSTGQIQFKYIRNIKLKDDLDLIGKMELICFYNGEFLCYNWKLVTDWHCLFMDDSIEGEWLFKLDKFLPQFSTSKFFSALTKYFDLFSINSSAGITEAKKFADEFLKRFDVWLAYE